MELEAAGERVRRAYPHLVTQGARNNRRWSMIVENDGPGDRLHEFVGVGFVDAGGAVTTAGRAAILRRLATEAPRSQQRVCVVWGPTDCSWIDSRGRVTPGSKPPEGVPVSIRELNATPAVLEDVWTIRIAKGEEGSHLCIRNLALGYVEVALGAPMILSALDEPLEEGEDDPAEGLIDEEGRLVPPASWRGQPVTGVAYEWCLLGPVQPTRRGIVLRDPWPDDLRAACEAVAERKLSEKVHAAAWRAYDPERPDMMHVGVLAAG